MKRFYALEPYGKDTVIVTTIDVYGDIESTVDSLVAAAAGGDANAWRHIARVLEAYAELVECARGVVTRLSGMVNSGSLFSALAGMMMMSMPSMYISRCGVEPAKKLLSTLRMRYKVEERVEPATKVIDLILLAPEQVLDFSIDTPLATHLVYSVANKIIDMASNCTSKIPDGVADEVEHAVEKAIEAGEKLEEAIKGITIE